MTAIVPEGQPLRGQKRRRGAIEEDYSTAAIPHLRHKKAERGRQSQQETNSVYWESLSKVWLTRRALLELDRRNTQRACPVQSTVTRGLDLGDAPGLSKQLKCFARHGGPDLRDLVGYTEPSTLKFTHVMPSHRSHSRTQSKSGNTLGDSTAKTTTSKTRKTSPYDPNFEQSLIDHGIYPDDYDFPDGRDPPRPKNEDEILRRLGQPRPSLSPSQFSDKEFRTFKQTSSRALNEDAVIADVFPLIQGTARIPSAKNLGFGNLEPLIRGNFVDAKPDFYDGVRPQQIDLRIREELGSYITPSTQQQAPALPNLFTEVKGPDGSGAVAKRQACYDGAVGARGIHEFRSFRAQDSMIYDHKAYNLTSTYHNGNLKFYTTHPIPSKDPDVSREYHMTQLGGWDLTGSREQFRQGAGAFRNARDWAKMKRDELIAAANSKVRDMPKERSISGSSTHISHSTIDMGAQESDTSADELSQDVGHGSSFPYKCLKREPGKRSSNHDLKVRPDQSDAGASSRSRSRGRLSHRR